MAAGGGVVVSLVLLLFAALVLLVVGGFFAVVFGGGFLLFRAFAGAVGRAEMETTEVGSIEPGPVEVSGVVRLSADGETVRGPFTGEEGVAVETTVENYRTRGGSMSHYWSPVHTEERVVPFLVEDDTGQVLVDPPPDPAVTLDAEERIVHPGDETPERVRRYLERTEGVDVAESIELGPVDAGLRRRYGEGVLADGDRVTVRGTAVRQAGRPAFRIVRGDEEGDGDVDFVVSDGPIGGVDINIGY